jgi:hypothetical protein
MSGHKIIYDQRVIVVGVEANPSTDKFPHTFFADVYDWGKLNYSEQYLDLNDMVSFMANHVRDRIPEDIVQKIQNEVDSGIIKKDTIVYNLNYR